MSRRTLLAVVVLLLSACSPTERSAKDAVRARTKDPDSVQFKDVVSSSNKDSWGKPHPVVCGMYNAKNAYGGYAGFEPFIVDDGQVYLGMEVEYLVSKCPRD